MQANLGANRWNKNTVDASQLDVDFQTQIGQRLRGSFVHIFGVNTLGCHPENSITNTLYFS